MVWEGVYINTIDAPYFYIVNIIIVSLLVHRDEHFVQV